MKRIDGKTYPTVTEDSILGFFGEYRFLSNFHICEVVVDRVVFNSSEAAYMAQKTLDSGVVYELAALTDPKEAKKLGSEIKLREDWEEYKSAAMLKVLIAKFSQNKYLADKLLLTGNRYLEETNYWGDKYWGVHEGQGKNMLGKLLMDVRDNFL